jgi:uncharacterized protein (DUF2267 family)
MVTRVTRLCTPSPPPGQPFGMSDDFSPRVRELAGLADDQDVERVATAVLSALAGQLSGPTARRLAEGLPEPYALPLLQAGEVAEPGGVDRFYSEVEERSGLKDAPAAVGAVLRALAETAPGAAVSSAAEQLPDELVPLLQGS